MIAHWWVGLFRFWESLNRFPMGYFIPFYDSLFSLSDSNQIMTAAKKRNKINDFRNKNSFLKEFREEWFYSKLQILARDERIWNFLIQNFWEISFYHHYEKLFVSFKVNYRTDQVHFQPWRHMDHIIRSIWCGRFLVELEQNGSEVPNFKWKWKFLRFNRKSK